MRGRGIASSYDTFDCLNAGERLDCVSVLQLTDIIRQASANLRYLNQKSMVSEKTAGL